MPNQDTHRKPAPAVAGGHAGKDARPALAWDNVQANTAANQTSIVPMRMVRPGSIEERVAKPHPRHGHSS